MKGRKNMIKITLKDGSVREVAKGSSILDVAKSISEGLARNAQCGKVNGEVKDLRTILMKTVLLKSVHLIVKKEKML